ncbi:MAG: NYN domain-containing protein [Nitrospirae bacterium]|nr:NYN domain-containing protein [Nitrospirota bacterium]
MNRVAIFIDGGYMADILRKYFGKARIHYGLFAKWVAADMEIFRTYYYDCLPYQSPTPTLEEAKRFSSKQKFLSIIDQLERFKVRTGKLEFRGIDKDGNPIFIQKLIDMMIGIDITLLSVKRAITHIAIISGDSDFIPAIKVAKDEGVLVKLFHGPKNTFHDELWKEADERREITQDVIESITMKKYSLV